MHECYVDSREPPEINHKWDHVLVNRFNQTSGVAVVTPTDRPKSVRKRCVIEDFGGVFCVVPLLFWIFL